MEPTQVKELAHLKIPLEEILEATNNFSDDNIIGKGGFGHVYRGKLIRHEKCIKIVARRLGHNQWQGEAEFWTEISMLSALKSESVVDLIGYCYEKGEQIVINRHYPRGSLLTCLSNPTKLNWLKRIEISREVADIINRIHNVVAFFIIHRNINSSTIVLNRDRSGEQPKLSGFEHSIKLSIDRRDHVFYCEAIGTTGYMDPAIEKTGGVTRKSDIYSFGIVLFELLCGRKAYQDDKFLGPLAKFHYENGTLKEIIHPDIWKQMNPKSFESFSRAAYSCLQEDPTQRPDGGSLYFLLHMSYRHQLANKTEEDEVEKIEKKDYTSEMDEILRRQMDPPKVKNLEHWRIELRDVLLAIDCFKNKSLYIVARNTHSFMRTELRCLDREYYHVLKGKNSDEIPKKQYTVMIKWIDPKKFPQTVAEEYLSERATREIEILSSCNHDSIESFLGFCELDYKVGIVSEFVSHSYLDCYLDNHHLTWEMRLKVCIDVARGLCYLHNEIEGQNMVIHRNLKCENIVLGISSAKIFEFESAKILEFGKSVFLPPNQDDDALHFDVIDLGDTHTDPEYIETGKLKRESDVFSFGVVMLEILCGKRATEFVRGRKHDHFVHVAHGWLKEGIIKRMVTPVIMGENADMLNKGPNEDSLDTFIQIISQCVALKQNQRPTMKVVVKELEKALSFQENNKDIFKISFQDIQLATQNFSRANYIGGGGFGGVFKGQIAHKDSNGHNIIVAKKLDKSQGQGEKQFYDELQILYKYKHENIIGLLGYSNETDEKIIVYEHASKGSLDKSLVDARLTWRNRLHICIDVAVGLDFLHGGTRGREVVIHRDIKTANILLFEDWKAKLGDFGLSLISTITKDSTYAIDRTCGTRGYVDPLYLKSGILTIESDIYSFGVVLFEILSGKAIYTIPKHESRDLLNFIKLGVEEGKQDGFVFKAIKEEIVSKSLTTFLNIVCECLEYDREKRPTSKKVLTELKKSLEFQEEDKI